MAPSGIFKLLEADMKKTLRKKRQQYPQQGKRPRPFHAFISLGELR